MKIATGHMAGRATIAACLCGVAAFAYAQSGGVGPGGSSAAPSSANVTGGAGTVGSTLAPTPGLATPGGAAGSGRTGGLGTGLSTGLSTGRVPNNMRANGTSLNQNPDPRVPSLGGRPAAPR